MKKKYGLICMAPDGKYQVEHNIFTKDKLFESIEDARKRSGDMGSRWYFYPYHFVVNSTLSTIVESPDGPLSFLAGEKIKQVQKMFKRASEKSDAEGMDIEEFEFFLAKNEAERE